jgi:pilus assembly protein CpaE
MLAFVVNGGQPDRRIPVLEQLVAKLGYVISRKDTIAAVVNDPALKGNSDSLVLIPVTESSPVNVELVIGLASQFKGRAFAIYVTDEISQADYKALIRTGAADCVSWESANGEIFEICHRRHHSGAVKPAGPGGPNHTVICFRGTGGGAGNTTLALETGVFLASQKDEDARRVAIVDLDFQRSVICDYVNLTPQLDIADFIRNPQRLDKYMLEIFTSKHPSGLDLFACAHGNIDYGTGDVSAIFSLLDQLAEHYDTVLLDVPGCRTGWLDRVLTNSDFVFITGRYSVPSVKQIAHELKNLRQLGIEAQNLGVIINWCQRSLFGSIVRKSDVESALAGQRIFYVQEDQSFALDCINVGNSMAAAGSMRGICRDIKKISEAAAAVRSRVTP